LEVVEGSAIGKREVEAEQSCAVDNPSNLPQLRGRGQRGNSVMDPGSIVQLYSQLHLTTQP